MILSIELSSITLYATQHGFSVKVQLVGREQSL
jgi:hypothetical protein